MAFWTIIKVGLKSLIGNALRSFLAMLGIIIGVGAVIAMLALGQGAREQVMQRVSVMGTNLLIVRPGQSIFHGVFSGIQQTLTEDDALALVTEVPGVRQVAPAVGGSVQIKYLGRNWRTRVTGTTATYLPIRDFAVAEGRTFTENEVENSARVVLLGPVTVDNLFGADDAVGQIVKVNGINFTVIGVLKSKGDQGWFNPDDQAMIPYTTAMSQLLGLDYLAEIDVHAEDGADTTRMIAGITRLLRKRHRLQEGAADDFNIRNQADMIETANQFTRTFTILLGGIASISLLVGGIGIMNIMLVTVTERTREIGIRKAIGAKERSILMQFLIEAVIVSGLGGALGIVLGVVAALLVERFTEFTTVIAPANIVMALSFSAMVGIFFGWYPALRAARLDPVDALRYE
ncbi:MAG TPA: ABC transporter permease [Phycisphaerae bacterium]|nr:ABC transporter permease [Phycisphaerae bacterium]